MRRLLLFGTLAATPFVQADDAVRVSYNGGYQLLAPTEHTEIVIRSDSASPSSVDSYFMSVRQILDAARSPTRWTQPPAIHADTVRVEIAFGSNTYVLETSYGENGPEIPLNSSEFDRQQLAALKTILALTAEKIRSQITGENVK